MLMGRRIRRLLGVTVVAGGLALGSSLVSSANAETGIWHQSYQRLSQDATCTAQEWQTPWQDSYTGQREWTPSWAQWANGGTGGWVCNRAVVWAQVVASNCQLLYTDSGTDYYGQFGNGWSVGGEAPRYTDAACTVPSGSLVEYYVLASSSSEADARCDSADPRYTTGAAVSSFNTAVWFCNPFG